MQASHASHTEQNGNPSTAESSQPALGVEHPAQHDLQLLLPPAAISISENYLKINEKVGETVIFPQLEAKSIKSLVLQPQLRIIVPPGNFSMVIPGIFRSSFPQEEHFPHLRSMNLQSILTLVPEEYPEANTKFMQENGIRHFQFGIPGNKQPTVEVQSDKVMAALGVLLDRRNHPILIHCNKGKHRTGCVVGCFRKLQKWALESIFKEYRWHADPKSRALDERFIDLFDVNPLDVVARCRGFSPEIPAQVKDDTRTEAKRQ